MQHATAGLSSRASARVGKPPVAPDKTGGARQKVATMNWRLQQARAVTRRHFFKNCQLGLGAMALGSLLGEQQVAAAPGAIAAPSNPLAPKPPHYAPRARSVIYLHMSGSPPQQELFDWKPKLVELNMQPCPDELLENQRFAFIKGHPKLLGTPYKFAQYGPERGLDFASCCRTSPRWLARSRLCDRCRPTSSTMRRPSCFCTPARRGPAARRSARGSPTACGSENQDLPGFVVLLSGRHRPQRRQERVGQRLSAERLPGRAMPRRRRTRCSTSATPRACRATRGAAASTR